jgi:hypothetical protein
MTGRMDVFEFWLLKKLKKHTILEFLILNFEICGNFPSKKKGLIQQPTFRNAKSPKVRSNRPIHTSESGLTFVII